MPISKSNLVWYLTSVEPDIEQANYAQSFGGYAAFVPSDDSKSLVYPTSALSAAAGVYDEFLEISSPFAGAGSDDFLGINDEIISVRTADVGHVSVSSRAVNGRSRFHLPGDPVYRLGSQQLFNNSFNADFKQYRCVALRNNSTSDSAFSLKLSVRQPPLNAGVAIRFAVEIPRSDYLSSSASEDSANKTTVTDSSLKGSYDDNHFIDCPIRFTSGNNINQSRIVRSFDGETGTLVADSSFPYSAVFGDAFEIGPSPSQRVRSGLVSPSPSDRISSFSTTEVDFNVGDLRDGGDEFKPNDVIYVWLERAISKAAKSMSADSAFLLVKYKESA
jgi:hypothetical protein